MREVAGYDPARYEEVVNRELREVLLAYEALVRERALVSYRHEQLVYVLGGTKEKKAPMLPPILKDDD